MDMPSPLFLSDTNIAAHGDDPFGRLVSDSGGDSPSELTNEFYAVCRYLYHIVELHGIYTSDSFGPHGFH